MPKYYAAYGSNLNKQMRKRCPDSKIIGTAFIRDYELLFKRSGAKDRSRSCLTAEPKKGAYVPVGIWTLTQEDEQELDRREGFPKSYYKTVMELEVAKTDGTKARLECLIYIKSERSALDKPDPSYVKTCVDGYRSFNFDEGSTRRKQKVALAGVSDSLIRLSPEMGYLDGRANRSYTGICMNIWHWKNINFMIKSLDKFK